MTLGTGVGYYSAAALTSGAGGNVDKDAKNAISLSYLSFPATFRTGLGICPGLAADTMAQGTNLNMLYFNLFLAAKDCFLEGKGEVSLQAIPFLWSALGGPTKRSITEPAKVGFENLPQPAKAKTRKAFQPINIHPPVTIIATPLSLVREYLVGLVYLLSH